MKSTAKTFRGQLPRHRASVVSFHGSTPQNVVSGFPEALHAYEDLTGVRGLVEQILDARQRVVGPEHPATRGFRRPAIHGRLQSSPRSLLNGRGSVVVVDLADRVDPMVRAGS